MHISSGLFSSFFDVDDTANGIDTALSLDSVEDPNGDDDSGDDDEFADAPSMQRARQGTGR